MAKRYENFHKRSGSYQKIRPKVIARRVSHDMNQTHSEMNSSQPEIAQSLKTIITANHAKKQIKFCTSKLPAFHKPLPEKLVRSIAPSYKINSKNLLMAIKRYNDTYPEFSPETSFGKKSNAQDSVKPSNPVIRDRTAYPNDYIDKINGWSSSSSRDIIKRDTFKSFNQSDYSIMPSYLWDDNNNSFNIHRFNKNFDAAYPLQHKVPQLNTRKILYVKNASISIEKANTNKKQIKFEAGNGRYYHRVNNPVFLKKFI